MNYKSLLKSRCFLLAFTLSASTLSAQDVAIKQNSHSGALDAISINGDSYSMNWILKTDGSQYRWVTSKYGWGLGYLTTVYDSKRTLQEWATPDSISDGTIRYAMDGVSVTTHRAIENGELIETYTFKNETSHWLALENIGIYTPFNDNYPNSQTCITNRCNTHIWAGDNYAYVEALRMGGNGPHLGLIVTNGSIKSYEVWERGRKKDNSHYRGVFALNIPDIKLHPQETYTISWRIFSFANRAEFRNKLIKESGLASANKYVAEKGEIINLSFVSQKAKDCKFSLNGSHINATHNSNTWTAKIECLQEGDLRIVITDEHGLSTHADLLVVKSYKDIIDRRADFIIKHQQMNNLQDARYGAFMVYDCEADSIYPNNTPNSSYSDRDEGAERVGMGVFLAERYLMSKKKDKEMLGSLLRYASFLRNGLQTANYKTFSNVDKKGRNRAYNYPWIAEYYFHMYKITGNKQYATDGYQTLQSLFKQFGHGFYAIGHPVLLALNSLKDAGMTAEYAQLLSDYEQLGETFIKNGLNYPKSEVNYEQSIVAPSLEVLSQLYLATHKAKYLDEAKRQMATLDAFNGFQPSFHLHDIAIRHWDGHWFGKYEMFGDTFPHYWSTVTAGVFHYYALATGENEYQKRAEDIVRNNLCLFMPDGKASCAYMYPERINGEKAHFYDPYANDQDWALAYYLKVMGRI